MTRNEPSVSEIVLWAVAALCVVLALAIAPSQGGSTVIPLAIAAGLGYLASRMSQRRRPAGGQPTDAL